MFELLKNQSTSFYEIDIYFSKTDNADNKTAIKSLESSISSIFLSEKEKYFSKGYLYKPFEFNINEVTKLNSRLDVLFLKTNRLSLERFLYVLWLISGCAESEINILLNSISNYLEKKGNTLFKPVVNQLGNVNILIDSNNKASDKTEYLTSVLDSTWISLGMTKWLSATSRPNFYQICQTLEPKDLIFTQIKKEAKNGNLFELLEILTRWFNPKYIRSKVSAKSFIENLRFITNEKEYFIFGNAQVGNLPIISRLYKTMDVKKSVKSLFNSFCLALNIKCENPSNVTLRIEDEDLIEALRRFVVYYDILNKNKSFQLYHDFRASAKEIKQYSNSEMESFYESFTALSDILKLLLFKRFEVYDEAFSIIASNEYRLIIEVINPILVDLKQIPQDLSSESYPEPILELYENHANIIFDENSRISFSEFQLYLAYHIYGVLTGDLIANNLKLSISNSLLTYSSIDIILNILLNKEVRSMLELVSLIDDYRNNLIVYCTNYKNKQPNSKTSIKPVEYEVQITPTRDRGILASTETRILIVEDEPIIAKYYKMVLSSIGCEVITAIDGKEGYDKFKRHRHRISLIITDYQMPRMNGGDLTKKIRRESKIPIILITGMLKQKSYFDLGINAFLDKPASENILIETILDLLARYKPNEYAGI